MKTAFLKYKNLGNNLGNEFNIYSDKGFLREIGRNLLLSGSFIEIEDDASKIHILPKIYDLIASGKSDPKISGLRFLQVNDTQIYGFNNYNLVSTTTGERSNSVFNSICINDSGDIIAAGTTQTLNNNTGVYIYTGSSIKNSWQLKQTILHSPTIGEIGASLSINNNGSILLATSLNNLGYGIIYTGSAANGWNVTQILSGTSLNTNYGKFSAINGNGDIIAITAQNEKKAYIYTGNLNNWNLKQIISGSFGADFGYVSINSNGGTIVLSDPSNSSTIIYTGSKTNGWNFSKTIFDSVSSATINDSGDILLINDRTYSVPQFSAGAIKIYTGGFNQNWNLKQVITGEEFNGFFGTSSNIKNNLIIASAPNVGKIYLYTGSKTFGWSKFKTFQENSDSRFGNYTSISKNDVAVASLRRPRVGAGGSYTAGLNIYNHSSTSGTPTYYSSDNNYALWRNPVMRTWNISSPDKIGQNLTSPSDSFITNTNDSLEGNYTATNSWNGSLSISKLNNKLRVYNTPGVTGFAGTYTSGIFTLANISRIGFRNDQNLNFYIYKNNSPTEWRAVEELSNDLFVWYTNLNGNNDFPPVTGWLLGGGNKQPSITPNFNPVPEINFGTCGGKTILYPIYVYQANSSDSDINNIKFYSGAKLDESGNSNLFPQNTILLDMFPDKVNLSFSKDFYYSDFYKNYRYFLFRILENNFDKFLITRIPQNSNSGYYYWMSDSDYLVNSGKSTFQQARKIYYPIGNNIQNLKNISININNLYLNEKITKQQDINLNNLNIGDKIYIETNKVIPNINLNGDYTLQTINSGSYSGLNCLVGQRYIFANPQFRISGARCWDTGVNIWSILDNEFNYIGLQNCQREPNILPSQYWFTGKWSSSPFQNYYNFGFVELYSHNTTLKNISNFNDGYLLGYDDNYDYTEFYNLMTGNKSSQFIFNLPDGASLTGLILTTSTGYVGGLINSNTTETYDRARFEIQNLDEPSDLISGKYRLTIVYNDSIYSIQYTGDNGTYIKYSDSNSRYACYL